MAQAYLETTEWADIKDCNHVYYLEGDCMLAYVRKGTQEPYWFKKPITISRKGRKFKPVDGRVFETSLGLLAQALVKASEPDVIEVAGSKPGVVYYVNTLEHSCTCPGFTYRGDCKHIQELKK